MDLREIGQSVIEWIGLVQNKNHWSGSSEHVTELLGLSEMLGNSGERLVASQKKKKGAVPWS
jgi:hypothetical protein